MWFAQIN